MAEFLDQNERAYTRHYLGYPSLENRATYGSGIPVTTPTALLLEENMRSLLDAPTLEIAKDLLAKLKASRCNIENAKKRLATLEIAYTVKNNPGELYLLWQEDLKLCQQLSDLLAIPIYRHPAVNNGRIAIRPR